MTDKMEKSRSRPKKAGPVKHVDRSPSFIADVKSIKENLRIKEILRTVKMNSSMRIKTPKGCKVMQNKDFAEDALDDPCSNDSQNVDVVTSATNPDVNVNIIVNKSNEAINMAIVNTSDDKELDDRDQNNDLDKLKSKSTQSLNILEETNPTTSSRTLLKNSSDFQTAFKASPTNVRNRKLSLDQTILGRQDNLTQDEIELHLMGKSPLERKSSFFKKKMDSFLKNTQEVFKRQSLSRNISTRRGSMSVSLQSLNENDAKIHSGTVGTFRRSTSEFSQETTGGSASSLQSGSSNGNSTSSQSITPGNQLLAPDALYQGSMVDSQVILTGSQPITAISENSINSMNGESLQDPILNARAISMSSGLDSAADRNVKRKSSRFNRVTWVASEGLTNYFKRLIQKEESNGIPVWHSYQDFENIPEGLLPPKWDSKGRRLSYQRAVSGEDPVYPLRYQDSTSRKKKLTPDPMVNFELSSKLAEFTRNGVPPIKGFHIAPISEEAFAYLHWVEKAQNLEEFYNWKKLNSNEEERQTVIRELISTEADYIRHLMAIVEVFMAGVHALQDSGRLLEVDSQKLFTNIPDVLNASLLFWESSIYPMLSDAVEKVTPFNTELMAPGFCRFREIFLPYERYVCEQTKSLEYFRSLSNDSEFMTFLAWCHSQKACNRLQLSDIMVKPMQRLTKYRLILRRIIEHTETEPERTSLIAMETFPKNFVLDVNRTIRQREELEALEELINSIDTFEVDFKDEEIDKCFRMYSSINLRAPMVNCLPYHSRSVIYQGDVRFKDTKEADARIILLTDMLLICRRQPKGSSYPLKLIRQKYMIDKVMQYPRSTRKEMGSLIYVLLDEVGSSYHAFGLYESKDPSTQNTLKIWEQKIKEAKLTYDLGVWFAKNPSRDLSEVEMDSSSDYALSGSSKMGKQSSEDLNIEREARERVATMLHRSMGASTDYDFSQSMNTDSFDAGEISGVTGTSSGRTPGMHSLRHPMHRNSTGGSSRNSRLSSFQQSTSAASHDEPQPGPSKYNYRAGSSVEHLIPPQNPEDAVTSITVNVVSESESETVVTVPLSDPPPTLQTIQHTLNVKPSSAIMALVHSLPDLTTDPSPTRPPHRGARTASPSPGPHSTASERLYISHQEILLKNRLAATQQHQYLSPHHRGTSYPPPSPTRASLKRGLAFSYSFKNPPLSKMGHVNSQSHLNAEAGPLTSYSSQDFKSDIATNPLPGQSTSTDKKDKKSIFRSGNKTTRPFSSRKEDTSKAHGA